MADKKHKLVEERAVQNMKKRKTGQTSPKKDKKENLVEFKQRFSDDKKILKFVLKRLRKARKPSTRVKCKTYASSDNKVDDQVKLRCRQLPNILREMREAIMRQDWNETATLLTFMCHPGRKLYYSIILRTCFILLFNHPRSNLNLLQNFIRNITGYVLDEDINKFIKILFALRKSPLKQLESGKYIRKTGDYKVSRDPDFENL